MSLIAGIVALDGPLQPETVERFNQSLQMTQADQPWKVQRLDLPECILTCADTDDMWEGPRVIETSNFGERLYIP